MPSARACVLAVLAAAIAGGASAAAIAADDAAAAPQPPRARALIALLRQDCGSCHGMRLTGGLGPPLTPEALRSKPTDSLVTTILAGRAATAMPPWRRFISEPEARWLVARMLEGNIDAR